MKIEYALSNSFGFGGTNGCLIFKRYQLRNGGRWLAAARYAEVLMKIVVCIKQVPARDSVAARRIPGQLDRGSRSRLRNQRAGCLRARRGAATEGEARRRSGRRCAPGPRAPRRRIREALAKGADRAIHIEDEQPARSIRSAPRACWPSAVEPEKPDLVLTGLQSDDLGYGQTGVDPGRTAGPAARHHHHGGGEAGRRHPREARARERLVPARRDAAAGAAHHPVRHQQAALRHPDGHQEGQDQGDQAPHRRRTGRRRPRAPLELGPRLPAANAPSRRSCSTARRRKPPPSWWRS